VTAAIQKTAPARGRERVRFIPPADDRALRSSAGSAPGRVDREVGLAGPHAAASIYQAGVVRINRFCDHPSRPIGRF
jgi:hypothetical protein